ncbi:hypothetical protein [Amycolatopsis sp. BJA-103]|uniref:hypothetical protein n=1 Tax=Amycolatopsis sp. BJA-103 TaxID=1911175 RepID=UPI0011AF1181|nr:hypothetical protein [Amycolatopsis sp. BJA-103]
MCPSRGSPADLSPPTRPPAQPVQLLCVLGLLMAFALVMTLLGNPGAASVGYAVALGTAGRRIAG